MHGAVAVVVALAADEPEQALALGEQMARSALATLTATDDAFRIGWPDSVEAALRVGNKQAARSLLSLVEEGLEEAARPPYLAAQLERLRALVDASRDVAEELSVAGGLQAAADAFGRFRPVLVGRLRARAGRLAARSRRPGAWRVAAGRCRCDTRAARGDTRAGPPEGVPRQGRHAARD